MVEKIDQNVEPRTDDDIIEERRVEKLEFSLKGVINQHQTMQFKTFKVI